MGKSAFGFGMLANQMFPAALGVFIIVLVQDLGFAASFGGSSNSCRASLTPSPTPSWGSSPTTPAPSGADGRQYVFIGAILMGLTYVAMWQLHKGDGITYNFIYFLELSLVFYLGLTIFSVPYVAMGYEISEDFHERTQIMAVAQFIGQWAWVIAPWFWVILYDPSWFPEGADSGCERVRVGGHPVHRVRHHSRLVPQEQVHADRTDFASINVGAVLRSVGARFSFRV